MIALVNSQGPTYIKLNHSQNFQDPTSGTHMNNVKNYSKCVKCVVMASPIWEYFMKTVDPSKAKCNTCDQLISRGGSTAKTVTTSNMISQLKVHHVDEYSKYLEEYDFTENLLEYSWKLLSLMKNS